MDDSQTLRSIQEIANHYTQATGIHCSILTLANPDLANFPCTLCHQITGTLAVDHRRCLDLHLHSALQSERFGGSYTYFCDCSLLFWTSPVIVEGKMGHALIAGPALVLDPQEIAEELRSKSRILTVTESRQIESMPKIDIAAAHSLAEVLRMCAGWASGYREHRMVEAQRNLMQQSKLAEYIQELNQRNTSGQAGISYYPLAKEQELQEAIRLGDRQTARELMNELLGMIFLASGNTLERIRFRVMELIILLSRAAVQGGASEQEIMEISYSSQRELNQQRSTEAIARWISNLLHRYTDLVFEQKRIKHAQVILQAIHHIRRHYTGRLTLEETALSVGMSPTYFSRIFNAEMGCSFSSYVNRLRIELAKSLLLTTRYTLVEIAGLAGFEDQGYFSRVFKGEVGITPGSYRKRAGNFPLDTHEIHTESF
jgi:AraC-like DNA-binding protein/ligand-binding sensor protein